MVFCAEITTTSRFLKTLPIVSKQKDPVYLCLCIDIELSEKYPVVPSFAHWRFPTITYLSHGLPTSLISFLLAVTSPRCCFLFLVYCLCYLCVGHIDRCLFSGCDLVEPPTFARRKHRIFFISHDHNPQWRTRNNQRENWPSLIQAISTTLPLCSEPAGIRSSWL